jgi:hypothetical protein
MQEAIQDKFLKIFIIVVASFGAAFAVGLNKKEKSSQMSFMLFISEVLVHGVSGGIIGLLITRIYDDIFIIAAVSAIGGMVGNQIVYYAVKVFMVMFANVQKVSIDEINKVDLEGEEKQEG